MATIIFDETQKDAVNLDQIAFIYIEGNAIRFGNQVIWQYKNKDEATTKYMEILTNFGTEITEPKVSLDDLINAVDPKRHNA